MFYIQWHHLAKKDLWNNYIIIIINIIFTISAQHFCHPCHTSFGPHCMDWGMCQKMSKVLQTKLKSFVVLLQQYLSSIHRWRIHQTSWIPPKEKYEGEIGLVYNLTRIQVSAFLSVAHCWWSQGNFCTNHMFHKTVDVTVFNNSERVYCKKYQKSASLSLCGKLYALAKYPPIILLQTLTKLHFFAIF
jgi:hypothetical protein